VDRWPGASARALPGEARTADESRIANVSLAKRVSAWWWMMEGMRAGSGNDDVLDRFGWRSLPASIMVKI
jgi:hypothetical protein